MEAQFNNPETSDVQIKLIDPAGNFNILSLHRNILSSRSEFFERMFQSGMREGRQKIIEVQVPDLEEAVKLLRWMYSGDYLPPKETEELAEMWLIKIGQDPNYPGKRSVFKHLKGDWKKRGYLNYRYNRIIKYESELTSLISSFSLMGFEDGKVLIRIGFNPRDEQIIMCYLSKFGIDVGNIATYYFQSNNISEIRTLAKSIVENNTFEKRDLSLISKVSEEIKNQS